MESPAKLVKEKINIAEVVGQYVQLKKAGRNLTGRCPFHKERTPSFFVSPERGTYICFGCGEKGDAFSFLEKIEGLDFKTALAQLAEKAGVKLPKYSGPAPERKEKNERLLQVAEAAVLFFEGELAKREDVRKYLMGRGVKTETLKEWRLGYAPATWDALSIHLTGKGFTKEDIIAAGFAVQSEKRRGEIFDRFRGRIIFPIFDAGGSPIAVSGRYFEKVPGAKDDAEPAKYINSPETDLFKKSKVLYGYDRARNPIRKADCILLVEGQFDLILAHQSGLPFSVALSGTALTEEHLTLLSRLSKRLVLALDADAAGIRAGLKSAHMALSMGFDVKIPAFPEGKDPADVAQEPEKLKAAVRASRTAIEFFLDALKAGARDERAYKKAVETQVLPLIAAIGSSIDREHFVKIVAENLRTPEEAVRAEVAKASKKDGPVHPEEEQPSHDGPAYSSFERSAALLLSHFGEDSAQGKRARELMGRERTESLVKRLAEDAERLRFEFDALGDDAAATGEALLMALERGKLEEELKAAKSALAEAERQGSAEAPAYAKRVDELSRKRQQMRG